MLSLQCDFKRVESAVCCLLRLYSISSEVNRVEKAEALIEHVESLGMSLNSRMNKALRRVYASLSNEKASNQNNIEEYGDDSRSIWPSTPHGSSVLKTKYQGSKSFIEEAKTILPKINVPLLGSGNSAVLKLRNYFGKLQQRFQPSARNAMEHDSTLVNSTSIVK